MRSPQFLTMHFPEREHAWKSKSKRGPGSPWLHFRTQARAGAALGPSEAKLGEMSIALAEDIGGENVNPRNGDGVPEGKILYIVFPYSSRSNAWPLTNDEIKRASEALLDSVGGQSSVLACEGEL